MIDSPSSVIESINTTEKSITRKTSVVFLLMVTISTIIYSMLESVRVSRSVFSLSTQIVPDTLSVSPIFVTLVAIGLIEIGSLSGLKRVLNSSNLITQAESDLNIFSNHLLVGIGFISLFGWFVMFSWLSPTLWIPISITSIALMVIYYSEALRRGLSTSYSDTEYVDTQYLQSGL